MFWRTEDAKNAGGTLLTLLDKPEVTLREVLDDEYVLQEVKCQNKRLIEFLMKPDNLASLTALCVTEPANNEDDKKRYKYCHLASEIFAADANELTIALSNSRECFRILFSLLPDHSTESAKAQVNPLLASFFMKIFVLLVSKQMNKVLEYMQSEPRFLNTLVSNLDISAIADCLFRLAYGNDNEEHTIKMKAWLTEQEFVSKLITQFDTSRSDEVHQSASYLLCELIRCLRDVQYGRDEKMADPLLEQLQSSSTLSSLLDRMFPKGDAAPDDSIIYNGCAVFMTLLQTVYVPHNPLDAVCNLGKGDQANTQMNAGPSENDVNANTEMEIWTPDPDRVAEKCLLDRLDDFKRFLCDQGTREPILLPMGTVEAPLGTARLAVTKLLAQVLTNGLPEIHAEFGRIGLVQDLLELFFKHKWNNFLHTNVLNVFTCIFYCRLPWLANSKGTESEQSQENVKDKPDEEKKDPANSVCYPSPLIKQLLESHFLELPVQKCQECNETNATPSSITPPYVGHLMRIAMYIHYAMQEGPHRTLVQEIFETLPEEERTHWNQFVEAHLLPYIKRCEPDQVGMFPSIDMDFVSDKPDDFGTKLAASLEQAAMAFAEYNNRCKMSSDIPEDFGYAPDAFTVDHDEPVYQLMTKAADISFQMGPIPEPPGESAFEDMCAKRINLCGDSSDDDDLDDEGHNKSNDWINKDTDQPIVIGCGEPTG